MLLLSLFILQHVSRVRINQVLLSNDTKKMITSQLFMKYTWPEQRRIPLFFCLSSRKNRPKLTRCEITRGYIRNLPCSIVYRISGPVPTGGPASLSTPKYGCKLDALSQSNQLNKMIGLGDWKDSKLNPPISKVVMDLIQWGKIKGWCYFHTFFFIFYTLLLIFVSFFFCQFVQYYEQN